MVESRWFKEMVMEIRKSDRQVFVGVKKGDRRSL